MDNKRVRLIIHGKVQGVFFRASTCNKARALGLCGFVRNREDGTVEVVAEGKKERLLDLTDWCHSGPEMAKVVSVDSEWQPYNAEFDGFTVI